MSEDRKPPTSSATDQMSKSSQGHFRADLLPHGDKSNTKNSYTLKGGTLNMTMQSVMKRKTNN